MNTKWNDCSGRRKSVGNILQPHHDDAIGRDSVCGQLGSRRKSISVCDTKLLKNTELNLDVGQILKTSSHEGRTERRKTLVDNVMTQNTSLAENNLIRRRRASVPHVSPVKTAVSNSTRVSNCVSVARQILSEIDKQKKEESRHRSPENQNHNERNVPPSNLSADWYSSKRSLQKSRRNSLVEQSMIEHTCKPKRRNSLSHSNQIRGFSVVSREAHVTVHETENDFTSDILHLRDQHRLERGSSDPLPPIPRSPTVESPSHSERRLSDSHTFDSTLDTILHSGQFHDVQSQHAIASSSPDTRTNRHKCRLHQPAEGSHVQEPAKLELKTQVPKICITRTDETDCPTKSYLPNGTGKVVGYGGICGKPKEDNSKCSYGGQQTGERIKTRHDHTFKLKKLLKSLEDEMPTQALLQLKKLRLENNKS